MQVVRKLSGLESPVAPSLGVCHRTNKITFSVDCLVVVLKTRIPWIFPTISMEEKGKICYGEGFFLAHSLVREQGDQMLLAPSRQGGYTVLAPPGSNSNHYRAKCVKRYKRYDRSF